MGELQAESDKRMIKKHNVYRIYDANKHDRAWRINKIKNKSCLQKPQYYWSFKENYKEKTHYLWTYEKHIRVEGRMAPRSIEPGFPGTVELNCKLLQHSAKHDS